MSTPLNLHTNVKALITVGGDTVISQGASFPADGTAGYAPGAIHIDTTNAVVYINEGTAASSDFDAITTA